MDPFQKQAVSVIFLCPYHEIRCTGLGCFFSLDTAMKLIKSKIIIDSGEME